MIQIASGRLNENNNSGKTVTGTHQGNEEGRFDRPNQVVFEETSKDEVQKLRNKQYWSVGTDNSKKDATIPTNYPREARSNTNLQKMESFGGGLIAGVSSSPFLAGFGDTLRRRPRDRTFVDARQATNYRFLHR
jgi:hypothetical protein